MVDYKKHIHELVDKIHRQSNLKRIYKLMAYLYERETP